MTFQTKTVLTSTAIRKVRELARTIKIGESFWVIAEKAYTKEPLAVQQIRRIGPHMYVIPADWNEEDPMDTLWPITDLTSATYPGAWLKEDDAANYLRLLQECWKQTPQRIAEFAKEAENKIKT